MINDGGGRETMSIDMRRTAGQYWTRPISHREYESGCFLICASLISSTYGTGWCYWVRACTAFGNLVFVPAE